MAESLRPWNDGHKHMWTYFGGMATCVHCAAETSPGGKVTAPSRRSKAHRAKGLEAKKRALTGK